MVINTNNLLGPLGCLALLVIEGTLGPSDSWYLMFFFLPIPGHLGLQDRLVDLGRSSWLLTSLVQLLFTHNINRWSSLHIVLSQRNPHRHWNNLPEKSCNSGGALWRFGTCLTQGKARTYMPINSQFPMGYGLWVMGSTARGLPFCAWDASQNQTRLPIPAFKVEKTTSDVESIWSRTITLVEIKLFNMCI